MNIQGILPQLNNLFPITKTGDNTKCSNEFDELLHQITEDTELKEYKDSLDKKYDINIVITDYSCAQTDSQAEGYDLYSLDEKFDMHGGRNVVISRDSLKRMQNDPRFRAKVIKSIEDMPWRGRLTGGIVKSTGVFIHEDGTGGYWMEFDWGDEEDAKKPRSKFFRSTDTNNLNTQVSAELDQLEVDFESVAPYLMDLKVKKE